jgi:GST-like protein
VTTEQISRPKRTFPAGYVPPKVWSVGYRINGGAFASINKPTAGAQFEKELPVGKHPHQLYSLATPNGVKVGGHAGGTARRRPFRAPNTTPG